MMADVLNWSLSIRGICSGREGLVLMSPLPVDQGEASAAPLHSQTEQSG